MKKIIRDFKVIDNRECGSDTFVLTLNSGEPLPPLLPGQFAEVRVDNSPDTFLRRPLSIYDVDYDKRNLDLLIQVVGAGTSTLSRLLPGDSINLILPLGNSFSIPDSSAGRKIVLIGGGVGIAPLLLLGRSLKTIGLEPEFILGFRNKERVISYERFSEIGRVYITTEDGSAGERGFVTDHSALGDASISDIYCCGPDPMMKAVASYATNKGINCEVSLENLMACGIGACLCCVVDTVSGRVCSCTDGPVFNIKALKWQTNQ